MSRTRKWSMVAQEATRLAGIGASPLEIAEKIGVNKSTVTRWIAAGKLPVPATVVTMAPVAARMSPAEWARAVRDEYALSATDEQLVTLAESALSLSRDMTAKAPVQLNASARFQSIAKQLDLLPKKGAVAEQQQPQVVNGPPVVERKTNPVVRRRSSADPRIGLRAVK